MLIPRIAPYIGSRPTSAARPTLQRSQDTLETAAPGLRDATNDREPPHRRQPSRWRRDQSAGPDEPPTPPTAPGGAALRRPLAVLDDAEDLATPCPQNWLTSDSRPERERASGFSLTA